ncbi:hypothetical protein PVAP13_1NG132119 [Panicum virgatum]|uniref:Uncharacterized protein n=1 Tax=Panicum virgatum TaxID=38727 RepID=A0A8T0WR28_PANVG|nr:hypothetical protein PVAP13_1NG419857 [Panicum virgatum]KAG2649784.1 hypothetical protein PVAP13_1NG132119 [Panicum virgatum]
MVEMADLSASMWRIEEKLRRMNEILDHMNGVAPPPSSRTASTPSTPTSAQVAASPASAPPPTPAGATTASALGTNAPTPTAPTTSPTSQGAPTSPSTSSSPVSPTLPTASSSCSTGVARAQGPGAAVGVDSRLGCAVPDDGHAARPRVPAEDPGPTLLQSRWPQPPGNAAAHGGGGRHTPPMLELAPGVGPRAAPLR